jgi:hypothetical protein
MASINAFFHDHPVTVSLLQTSDGGFVQIECGELHIFIGGEGLLAAKNAEQLAWNLNRIALDIRMGVTKTVVTK